MSSLINPFFSCVSLQNHGVLLAILVTPFLLHVSRGSVTVFLVFLFNLSQLLLIFSELFFALVFLGIISFEFSFEFLLLQEVGNDMFLWWRSLMLTHQVFVGGAFVC